MNRKTLASRSFNRSVLCCALAGCMALAAPMALAQSTSATIQGRVSVDSAPASDARVTVTNTATGLTRSATSGQSGNYVIGGLPPGSYRIDVTSNGQTSSQTVTVAVGQTATLNLGVGGVSETGPVGEATDLETVRVTAPLMVETKTSEVATYVSQRQIENLPQNSRNFLAFADTVPGMLFTSPPSGAESQLRSGAQGANQINVFIDGVGQKNYVTAGGVTSQDDSEGNPFPQLAIGEYKVITSNYKAEYDQISSAAVSAVTRSGTNEFSGSFFWDKTSEKWQKPTPLEEQAGVKAIENVEQYGGAFGGPIIRDKLHFFITYEAKDIIRPAPMQFPGAVDPARVPTEILSAYSLIPSRPFNQDTYFGKLSWQASDNHLIELTARRREEVNVSGVGGVNVPEAGTGFTNDEDRYDLRSLYSAENWMNDAHITFEEAAYNPSPLTPGGSNRYVLVQGTNAEFVILNTGSGGSYQDKGQKGWALQNDFTFFGWEGHTIKAGFKYKQIDLHAFQQLPPYPRYYYDVEESLTQPYRVEFSTARAGRDPFVFSENKQFGIYIQDDWEVNDKLTLNLGLRWDYEDIPSYTDFQLDPTIAAAIRAWPNIQNTDYNVEDYLNDGSRKNFKGAWQPRLGFSYDLTGDQRHVIFGGAGRAYDRNIFDHMSRERYGGAFVTRNIRFSTPLHSCTPSVTCVPFDPAFLTQAGIDAWVAANPEAGGEINLLHNDLKTPYSDQFSLGIRNIFEVWGNDWNTSVALSHIRSYDGFYSRLGNRRADGTFHEFQGRGQTWGGAPFTVTIPGYSSLVLSQNGMEYRLNSLLASVEKPYTDSSPWGFKVSYTYSDAKEGRPNASTGETYVFDQPYVTDLYLSTGVPEHRLVTTGMWSPGWGLMFSGRLVLQSHTPRSASNCLNSPAAPEPNYLCYYDPVTPNGTIGFKQLDLAAQKRWDTGTRLSFKVRADFINVFNWRNWDNFDLRYGTGNGNRLPVNPDLGERTGLVVYEPTRTFKLSFGLDW